MGTIDLTKENIRKVLKQVKDPEIDVDIVNLGLIYDIDTKGKRMKGNRPYIKMTLTTPACPLGSVILNEIEEKLTEAFGVEPEIDVVFDPPWNPGRMSNEAKNKLGIR